MSVDFNYLPILNETNEGFKNNTVRFRTKFKRGDSAHGNYLEMGEIKVPNGIETVILSIVSDDFSTHPNWLFVMPIQKTKLRFEPKKSDYQSAKPKKVFPLQGWINFEREIS